METLKLYGVAVDAAEYERLKRLTDILLGVTPADENKKSARRFCVQAAEMVVRAVRQHYGMEGPLAL